MAATVDVPDVIWTRARDQARADGLANVSEAIVALLDAYGSGRVGVTAWPAHELAAVATERCYAALRSLETAGAETVSLAQIRQLLAGLDLDQVAAQLETDPDDGLMASTRHSYRCPKEIRERADKRRVADGFRAMRNLVLTLITRYACGGITLGTVRRGRRTSDRTQLANGSSPMTKQEHALRTDREHCCPTCDAPDSKARPILPMSPAELQAIVDEAVARKRAKNEQAARERVGWDDAAASAELLECLRPAERVDYERWLAGYLRAGHRPNVTYDYPFASLNAGWYVATDDLTAEALYGRDAVDIIVPAGITASVPQGLGACNIYFMSDHTWAGHRVPVFKDICFV